MSVPAVALGRTRLAAGAQAQAVASPVQARRVSAPEWAFGVYEVLDPYLGTIQAPPNPPPDTRYVGADIEIDNGSDQPLSFSPAEIRVRDGTGLEFRGGSAIGSEPTVAVRNLNAGERSRGWVWFTVAADADLVEIAYVGPQPQFRLALD